MATSLIDLGTTEVSEDEVVETVEIFKLDDKVYSAPKDVSAGVLLKYMKMQAEVGAEPAYYYLMNELLGGEAYTALSEHPRLKQKDLMRVFEAVEKHAFADEEGN
jgi:hypothetical protein